jgi:hypothetical protein
MDLVKIAEETRRRLRLTGVRKMIALYAAMAFSAPAADFALAIANSVAGNSFEAKRAVLVVRPEGCADPAKARIEGTAEGLVNGARRSVPLKLAALKTPGVFAVFKEWPPEGVWVVKLTGSCQGSTAGVVVPIGPKGFIRESSKFFSRPASEAEVEASLKALVK